MSRIDVRPDEKGRFRVLVNMGTNGCYKYSSASIADQEAKRLHTTMPKAELHLSNEIVR